MRKYVAHPKKITAATDISSAMQKLIDDVANDFAQTMKQEGFESFSDMKNTYDWESAEIKEEIEYMVDKVYGGAFFDTIVSASDDSEMSYREFKKAVVAKADSLIGG